MKSILNKIFGKKDTKIYYTTEVFQSNGFPKYTFVKRDDIEENIDEIIASKNKVIMFLGYSKSGKTVYRKNYFEENGLEPIIYRCNVNSTINDLYTTICIDADLPIKSSLINSMSESSSKTQAVEASKSGIGAKHEQQKSVSNSENVKKVYPEVQRVDANYICNNFNRDNKIVILEDFHLVSNEFSKQISEDLKHFLDENILFIIVGIPSSPNRSLKNNPDLGGRTKKIIFDYIKNDEIEKIIDKGEEKLNLKIISDVRDRIKDYSMHNAYLVQAITQKLVLLNNVKKSSNELIRISNLEDVERACLELKDELKSDYQEIINSIIQGQRKQASSKAYNQYEEIIRAIKDFDIQSLERGINYSSIGNNTWNKMPPELIQKQIRNKTYANESSF